MIIKRGDGKITHILKSNEELTDNQKESIKKLTDDKNKEDKKEKVSTTN